jgi:hypothetical protein
MALSLVGRAADPQALKALLAAKLGGKVVEFKPSPDTVVAGPFGTSRVQLQGDGLELSEANAAAELLGELRDALGLECRMSSSPGRSRAGLPATTSRRRQRSRRARPVGGEELDGVGAVGAAAGNVLGRRRGLPGAAGHRPEG